PTAPPWRGWHVPARDAQPAPPPPPQTALRSWHRGRRRGSRDRSRNIGDWVARFPWELGYTWRLTSLAEFRSCALPNRQCCLERTLYSGTWPWTPLPPAPKFGSDDCRLQNGRGASGSA